MKTSEILNTAKQQAGVKNFYDGEIIGANDILNKPFYYRGIDSANTKYGKRLIICGSWNCTDGVFSDNIKFFTGSKRLESIFVELDKFEDFIGARIKIIKIAKNMFDVIEG